MQSDLKEIESLLLKKLSIHFEGVKIIKVNIQDDLDSDGDDILRIQIVFHGTPKDLNPSILNQSIRKIRGFLSEKDIFAFPMMSFISERDAKISTRA